MSLVPYKLTALARNDASGLNIIPNASVSVFLRGTGSYASLKTDSTGTTNLSNPFSCDANGEKEFWAIGGNYSITVAGGQSWDISLNGDSDITKLDYFADLANTPATLKQIVTIGCHTSGTIGGGNFIGVSSTGLTPDGGTISVSATAGIYWLRLGCEADVKISYFGCVFGGANDTVAAQKAIDHCNSVLPVAKKLIVDGIVKITSSLFIDRPVDTTIGEFLIEGVGKNSGFNIAGAVTMFDSRIPMGPAGSGYTETPVTEFVRFISVEFTSDSFDINAFVFSKKYLRLRFNGCRFRGIRGCVAPQFMQTIKFFQCHFRKNNTFFMQMLDGYDIRCMDCEWESAGRGFNVTNILHSGSFDDNLYQSCDGAFLDVVGAFGVSASRNYFEFIPDQVMKFGSGGGASSGLTIDTNSILMVDPQLSDVTYYPITLGAAQACSLRNNTSNGNLADNSGAAAFGVSADQNSVPINRTVLKQAVGTEINLMPNAGGLQAGATRIAAVYNIIATAVTNASVILPITTSCQHIPYIEVNNNSSVSIKVYPGVGQRIFGAGYNAAFVIAAGVTVRFYSSTNDDYWLPK